MSLFQGDSGRLVNNEMDIPGAYVMMDHGSRSRVWCNSVCDESVEYKRRYFRALNIKCVIKSINESPSTVRKGVVLAVPEERNEEGNVKHMFDSPY